MLSKQNSPKKDTDTESTRYFHIQVGGGKESQESPVQ